MKYYLSSLRVGNEAAKLKQMTENGNKKVAYIPNAVDYIADLEKRRQSDAANMAELESLGFHADLLDLQEYFNKSMELEQKLSHYDVIWVRGGNTFVLAQAMKLSGFDEILKKYHREGTDKVYGGYSAGIIILGHTLEGIHLVDDPEPKPYGNQHPTVWDGLHIVDYAFAPHYKSDHKESAAIDRVVEYFIEHKILFKAMRDGEVIILE